MSDRPALSRNVVLLSWISFLQDVGSEMLYPVLPLFLTGPLGAPASAVGLIEGLAEGCSAVMKALSGRLAEGRLIRPWIASGYGLAAAAKTLIAIATSWPMVLAGRVVDRLGKGIRTAPRDTLIALEMPKGRGRAFGFHRAADSAGAVIGPLLALGLYEIYGRQLRPVLVAAVIPAVVSALLTGLVRERRRAAESPSPTDTVAHQCWRPRWPTRPLLANGGASHSF